MVSFNSNAINVEDSDGNCPIIILLRERNNEHFKRRIEEIMLLLLSTREGSQRVRDDKFRRVSKRTVRFFRTQSILTLAIRAKLSVKVIRVLILLDPGACSRRAPLENIPIFDAMESENRNAQTYFELILAHPICCVVREHKTVRFFFFRSELS